MDRNYWKPGSLFVGDCMPFTCNGVFHVFYLRDQGHHNHPVLGMLGGHEWGHCASTDLKHFEELPVVFPLDLEAGECSNCTGSLLEHAGKIFAFYALRSRHFQGEQFRIAVSTDGGKSFQRWSEPELTTPPAGYSGHFRDPKAYKDENGVIHILMTTAREQTDLSRSVLNGELLHYTTEDLIHYRLEGTFLHTNGIPECSDIFRWGSHCHLFFSLAWQTYARIADTLSGPWQIPAQDVPASRYCAVMKTAPWKDNRRIGVAWLPPVFEQKIPCCGIQQNYEFGGRMIFREMIQNPDGSLGTAFLPEALENVRERIPLEDREVADDNGLAQSFLGEVPRYFRLEGEVDFPDKRIHCFGFQITSTDGSRRLVEFFPRSGEVKMDGQITASQWNFTEKAVFFRLERSGEILDLEFGGNRTLTLAGYPFDNGGLSFQVAGGSAKLKNAVLCLTNPPPEN